MYVWLLYIVNALYQHPHVNASLCVLTACTLVKAGTTLSTQTYTNLHLYTHVCIYFHFTQNIFLINKQTFYCVQLKTALVFVFTHMVYKANSHSFFCNQHSFTNSEY